MAWHLRPAPRGSWPWAAWHSQRPATPAAARTPNSEEIAWPSCSSPTPSIDVHAAPLLRRARRRLCSKSLHAAAAVCPNPRTRATDVTPTCNGLFQSLEAQPVRSRTLFAETLDLVGLVLVEIAGEEQPLAVVL